MNIAVQESTFEHEVGTGLVEQKLLAVAVEELLVQRNTRGWCEDILSELGRREGGGAARHRGVASHRSRTGHL